MLAKLKRQDCIDQYPAFPLQIYDSESDDIKYSCPEAFQSYILRLPHKTFRWKVNAMGKELVALMKAFHREELIFLGDSENPWLIQNNNYKPAKEAQEYLLKQKIGKRFNGAIQVESTELVLFTKHLCWLTRCNAALPYVHFTDRGQNVVGHICQYGNLHLDTLNEKADEILVSFVERSRLEFSDINSCR